MASPSTIPHELIRALIDGTDPKAKAGLVKMGAAAVEPLLDAAVGGHGRLGESLPELVDALKRIAKKDVGAVLPALKDHPAKNLVLWAIGYGCAQGEKGHRRAQSELKRHGKHRDRCLRAVAGHHLDRIEAKKGNKAAPTKKKAGAALMKRAAKKASKPAAKKRSATRVGKPAAKKRSSRGATTPAAKRAVKRRTAPKK